MNSRVVIPELMDDPHLPRDEHEHALKGLARLNRWSLGDSGLWRNMRAEAVRVEPQPLRVLDLATGSGDLPVRLALRARRAGLNLSIAGCDMSSTAIELAQEQARRHHLSIEFFQMDVIREPLPNEYDVIMTSLFLHHLSEQEVVQLLRKMAESTQRLILVNDLCRSKFNQLLVTVACHLLTRSRVVHFDGPTSVRAAFRKDEIQAMAIEAGLQTVDVQSHFPCRWLLRWRKQA